MSTLKNSPLVLSSLTAAILGMAVAAYSVIQVNTLSKEVARISDESSFNHYLTSNEAAINSHITSRINVFIDDQKKQAIQTKYDSYENAAKNTASGKRIYGKEDARFTLVEFSDIECPYCKKYHPTPKKVVDKLSEEVNWQFKHFPLGFHNPVAAVQAIATECAADVGGNRAFWVFLQQMMDDTKSNGQGAGDIQLVADRVGLDKEAFVKCMQAGEHRKTVEQDMARAKELGVNSTPVTIVVDNHTGSNIMLKGMISEQKIFAALNKLKQQLGTASNEKLTDALPKNEGKS